MIRFSVCVETIFKDLPLAERVARAAACGAAAVEFYDWRNKDLDAIARAKEAAGVDVAALGGLSDGRIPNDPNATDAAAADLLESVEAARQVGAAGLVVRSGKELEGPSRAEQLTSLGSVLAAAADAAAAAHVTLLLEARNARLDHPGTLLTRTADVLDVVLSVDRPNVKMLFDVYHQYVTEGSALHSIEANIDRIGHFHVADVPGRGEPGTGDVDFRELFQLLDSLDYPGYVGLEFHPSGDPTKAVRDTIHLALDQGGQRSWT